jgi:large subunit ribosomal protein L4
MPTMDVYNSNKEVVSQVTLSPSVFDVEVKEHLFYDVVRMQLANRRKGSASTKTRSEVRGGGRKPYRQKGTGRARAGTIRSPLWVGGGVIFGPQPRDYSYKVPKKVRKAALRSALTKKARDGKIVIINDFGLSEIKTKRFIEILKKLEVVNALIVVAESDKNLDLSSRNVREVKILPARGINVYDLLRYDTIIMTPDAVTAIEKALS